MITRSHIEEVLIMRTGKMMSVVEMDTVTTDGTNHDLNDPIASALMTVGIIPANLSSVTDADLVSVSDFQELIDRAELRLLENIQGNLDLVDFTIGPRKESLSQLGNVLEKAIARQQKKVESRYGDGSGLQSGIISLDFQQKADDEDA